MTTTFSRLILGVLLVSSSSALAEPRLPAARQGKVFVRLSPDAFAELQQRPIHQEESIQDIILGTAVRGQCVTDGNARLQPSSQDQSLLLVVQGKCVTTSVGQNGPATIHSTTTTQFVATAPITYDDEHGFRASQVHVDARSRVNTDGIEALQGGLVGRIVRGVAERRVAEAKPIAAEIARQKAIARIQSTVASQLEVKLRQVNRSLSRLREMVAILQPELTKDACFRAYKEQLVLYFQGEEVDHSALLRELPELTSTCELWVHQSAVSKDLQGQLSSLAAARDTASAVVDNARKLLTPDARETAGSVKTASAVAEPWLREHGDWFVVRAPATVLKDGPFDKAKGVPNSYISAPVPAAR